jgi:hypothetical protein
MNMYGEMEVYIYDFIISEFRVSSHLQTLLIYPCI